MEAELTRLRRVLADITSKIYGICAYHGKLELHQYSLDLMTAALQHRSTYRTEHSTLSSAIDMGNIILCDLCYEPGQPRRRPLARF